MTCPDCKEACDLAKTNAASIRSLGRTVRGDATEGNHGVLGELSRLRKLLLAVGVAATTAAIPGAESVWSFVTSQL